MVNSVIKGDLRAFEVPLSYKGHLCCIGYATHVILVEFCLLIPNIGPKVVNSVVEGDLRAFEVPLSDIGPL